MGYSKSSVESTTPDYAKKNSKKTPLKSVEVATCRERERERERER